MTTDQQTHTPGPWFVTEKTWSRVGAALEGTTPVVRMQGPCDAIIASLGADRTEQQANARLIAAAPDLLAAAKSALSTLEYLEPFWRKEMLGAKILESLNALDRAISKATSA